MTDSADEKATWERHYPPGLKRTTPSARPLWTLLEDAARDHADCTHLSFRGRSWTFAESARIVSRIAGGLHALGVEAGDRVGLNMTNLPTYPLLCFALWRLGAVGVGLNPAYSIRQLANNAGDAGVSLIVASDDPEQQPRASTLAAQTGAKLILCRDDASDLIERDPAAAPPSADTLAGLIAAAPRAGRPLDSASLAMIQYTGGTSGAPKGAMITHGSIWHATHQMRNWQHRLRDGREAWYAAAPMTHIAGLIHFVALPVLAAGEVVLTERFSVDELIALVGARRITMLTAVPTMVSAIAAHPDVASVDWRGVSHVMGGGASLAPELARTFHALTGLHVQMGYAMTETSCGGAAMPAEGIEGHESGTGVPVPGMQIEIRRVGAPGETVAHDEVGEICLGGPAMFTGYWGRELDPNETTPDGLFRSGDLGRITPDGVLYVIDRIKDVIICSGYKVYPGVVEHAVLEHSAVLEAVAVGMPDAYRGETVIVVAALRAGTALTLVELQDFLRERLSAMETPKRLVLLPMLPKTENGKLSRHLVRAALAELSKTTGQEPNDAG